MVSWYFGSDSAACGSPVSLSGEVLGYCGFPALVGVCEFDVADDVHGVEGLFVLEVVGGHAFFG